MSKIGVGFVGVGWMGQVQLQQLLKMPDVEVIKVHQPDKEAAMAVFKEIGLSESMYEPEYAKLLENPKIDAVWLVSPNAYHGPQAIQALEKGKHVFCEKPCATRFSDYLRQIELQRQHPELQSFVDYILNFDAMEQRLRGMVESGTFGKITQIQVNYRHPINISGAKAWKLSKEIMGDAMGMGIIHSISVMIWAMASQAKPVSVYAMALPAQVRPFEPDSIWNILVRFDNGAMGACLGNIDTSKGYDAYHNLSGTQGGFIFDSQIDHVNKVRYWSERDTEGKWVYPLDMERCKREGIENLAWPAGTSTPDSGDVIHHQTDLCIRHFLECVQQKKASPLNFTNSAWIADIGWAVQMSAALKKEIPLPLDKEAARKFFND